jgi:hypothetical protein
MFLSFSMVIFRHSGDEGGRKTAAILLTHPYRFPWKKSLSSITITTRLLR